MASRVDCLGVYVIPTQWGGMETQTRRPVSKLEAAAVEAVAALLEGRPTFARAHTLKVLVGYFVSEHAAVGLVTARPELQNALDRTVRDPAVYSPVRYAQYTDLARSLSAADAAGLLVGLRHECDMVSAVCKSLRATRRAAVYIPPDVLKEYEDWWELADAASRAVVRAVVGASV